MVVNKKAVLPYVFDLYGQVADNMNMDRKT